MLQAINLPKQNLSPHVYATELLVASEGWQLLDAFDAFRLWPPGSPQLRSSSALRPVPESFWSPVRPKVMGSDALEERFRIWRSLTKESFARPRHLSPHLGM